MSKLACPATRGSPEMFVPKESILGKLGKA
jgi:hypothetical protein